MKKPKFVRTTFAQYTINDEKDEGGSGIVYEASDDGGQKCAIKILDPKKATKEKLKRFKNEYWFCSKNKHPNIITVFDRGITDEGDSFFVMPLYNGSLKGLIGELEAKLAMSIFSKIMDGLEAAHKLGVIHRELNQKIF